MQLISLLEVFVATIVSLVAEYLWYSSVFFGQLWSRGMTTSGGETLFHNRKTKFVKFFQSVPGGRLVVTFLIHFLTAGTFLYLIAYSGLGNYTLVFMVWFGITGPLILSESLRENKTSTTLFLSAGLRLAQSLLVATVFTLF